MNENADLQANRNSQGWAAQVSGNHSDVLAWKALLKAPFDPWVEDYLTEGEAHLLLRTAKWKAMTHGHEVLRDAETLVERINGAVVLIYDDARNLRVHDVYEFDANGKRIPRIVAAAGTLSATFRMRGHLEKIGDPQAASFVQSAVAAADKNEKKAELLGHLSRASNWYELFKVIECFQTLDPKVKTKDWSDARQTANHYRHHRDPRHRLPVDPPTFEHARQTVLSIGKRVF